MFTTTRKSAILNTCCLNDVLHGVNISINNNVVELDYPFKDPHKFVNIVGTCNGLVCIAIDEDRIVVIWNPSTRKSHILPYSGKNPLWSYAWYVSYGFGCIESNDDYKVVEISCRFEHTRNDFSETCIRICSLKSGKWKDINGDFRFVCPLDEPGKFSNGALHWAFMAPSKDPMSNYSWNIFSVDLANETCGEVLQPVYDEGHTDLTLGTLREWLCVLCNYNDIRADVWVMKVYGVKDSWTKLVSVPCLSHPRTYQFPVPLCVSSDGKILLHIGKKLIVYDLKSCSFSDDRNFDECYEVCTFVDSLVSPPMPISGLGDR
ncbi:hypothetical protein QVD17_01126 [Tagetes erecta]|uniref:F-box associated beta-propeller type 1 domain-containing protein n=1 Tax=Tagetes erecta TaxID=13708 RepID=A0AAD8L4F3_TARER|nr:hypothetical protein QVD17_01126 [Tagetes erecta]